ncbi:hypothetical protein BerOc1_01062 [Pseudodesulfovibrio hydrargyri]|uniref:Periplasmic heavy metal sensor n=1 Tax=Pseudodesulfovibrio hydrargyri TaxID=2125990 RepID=A0A1J5N0G3_9BACT|nr:hypothetical protein [Pseudodesulfovibrio hydrargyri]OIQ49139.1 hypothetical protein BerOc1_01062 [Pseudodesulfovibrio hydrargyri]
MRKWKIWTAFLAVFLAGALSGVAGTGLYIRLHFAPPPDRETFRTELTERVSSTLSRELDLTGEAAKAVRAEVAATLDELEAVHAELRPRARAIVTDGIERVKGHLTQTQQAELDELIRRNRERPFSLFRLPPPPPPPLFP